ncbi:MAG: hypothetical protein ABIP48_28150 [Planctomycetota bacterium]
MPQADRPSGWEERGDPVLIVLPVAPGDVSAVLGPWLVDHAEVNRNMVRFLLPEEGLLNIYDDRDLIVTARCAMLAKEWSESEAQYDGLYKRRFYPELKKKLESRFDRYAILSVWDFQNPTNCTFHVEEHGGAGGGTPAAVEKHIRANFFAPEDFRAFVLDAANRGDTMQQVFALLRGEPLPGKEAIPYQGESEVYEEVLKVAAADKIAINVGGTWRGAREPRSIRARARPVSIPSSPDRGGTAGDDSEKIRTGQIHDVMGEYRNRFLRADPEKLNHGGLTQ